MRTHVEQTRRAIGFAQHPFRRHAAVQNKGLRHWLSLAIPANQGRAIIERRQRRGKSFQLLPQIAELAQALSFGRFHFQNLNDLRIEASPVLFCLPLNHPI
jgi:hypothetical protein